MDLNTLNITLGQEILCSQIIPGVSSRTLAKFQSTNKLASMQLHALLAVALCVDKKSIVKTKRSLTYVQHSININVSLKKKNGFFSKASLGFTTTRSNSQGHKNILDFPTL